MDQFISFQDSIFKTICHVYQHEDGRTLHLLPVVHIGENQYYEKLMEYIGEKICVYESLNVSFEVESEKSEEKSKTPQTFDEWLDFNEKVAELIDNQIGAEVKKFHRKINIRKVRRMKRLAKKNLGVLDERATTLFYQFERTNYAIHNLRILQIALADIMGLSYQYNILDYVNDIPNRSNWVHGDIDVRVPKRTNDEIIKLLKSPSPEFVHLTQINAHTYYGILYLIESLISKSINERRKELVNLLTILDEDDLDDTYLLSRNNIIIETSDTLFDEHDDVVVLYGAAHMRGIKMAAENAGFELISTTEFEVFRLEEE